VPLEIEADASSRAVLDEEDAATLPETENVLVRVVDAATGSPLPGAEVLVGSSGFVRDFGRRRGGRWPQADAEVDLRRTVKPRTADANGLVLVPRTSHGMLVGRLGNQWGERHYGLGREQEPLLLELATDRSLSVQVVDETGEPQAGIRVGIGVRGERQDYAEGSLETTEDEGLVVFRHLDYQLERTLVRNRRLFVTLECVLREPVEVELDPNALPEEAVRLTLPPTGRVIVHVKKEDGRPWEGTGYVRMIPIVEDPIRPKQLQRGHSHDRSLKNGGAVFAHVGLGIQLRVEHQEEDTSRYLRAEGAGPRKSGETVEFTLRSEGSRHWIVGRLRNAEDRALGRSLVDLELTIDGSTSTRSVRTVGSGRFRTAIVSELPSLMIERVRFFDGGRDTPARQAELGPVHTRRGEEVDLGNIQLRPLPLVVSGIVVDAAGEPVYWASVRTQEKATWKAYPDDPECEVVVYWNPVNEYMVQTDREGRFEVRGRPRPGELAITANREGYLYTERLPIVPGQEGITLVLEKEGALAGNVILGEGIPVSWIAVEVEAHVGPSRVWWSGTETYTPNARLNADGSFHVGNLLPGPSKVLVRAWNEDLPLVVVDDVVVVSGETNRDGRLQSLDLTGELRRIEVEVRGRIGDNPVEGHVAVLDETEAVPRHFALSNGRTSFVTRQPAVDLEVWCPGYRTARLETVRKSVKVELQEGIPVLFRLPPGIELPPAPAELRVDVTPIYLGNRPYDERVYSEDGVRDSQWEHWRQQAAPVPVSDRQALVRLPDEGKYDVYWRLVSGSSKSGGLRGPRGQGELIVHDTGETIVLEWGPDPESYAQALEALGRRP
jgi:hypothetical protein